MDQLLKLGEFEFSLSSTITLLREPKSGHPLEFMPQARYKRASTTPLNPHGHGPFCRLTTPGLPISSGVYALFVKNKLKYIGKARNLAERWGPQGYGAISPKNCFVGGQSTNCKMNHRILMATKAGENVELFVHLTESPGEVEAVLIGGLMPPWNGQIPLSRTPTISTEGLLTKERPEPRKKLIQRRADNHPGMTSLPLGASNMSHKPTWELIEEVTTALTIRGSTPFRLGTIISEVQKVDASRERTSIQPTVQRMTVNAGTGPGSPCGETLRRVGHGLYERRELSKPLPQGIKPSPCSLNFVISE